MVRAPSHKDFGKGQLSEKELGVKPFSLLNRWWQEAIDADVLMPDAAVLSTVDQHNYPNGRVVFIKALEEAGLVFFTNYHSQKGRELLHNPAASLVLFWPDCERQVRIRGAVVKTDRAASEHYFQARPRGSQLGAWASKQSEVLTSRDELEARFKESEIRFTGQEVPCPPHWGGYCLDPNYFEFWQGRSNRLHDRFSYTLNDAGKWEIVRLFP